MRACGETLPKGGKRVGFGNLIVAGTGKKLADKFLEHCVILFNGNAER